MSNRPPRFCSGIGWNKWLFFVAIACCALVLTYMPGGIMEFRYERPALSAGQLWRVVTAHAAHINMAHLFYNLLGLALICEFLWGDVPVRHGAGLLLGSALGLSAALWWLHPEIAWYAGLSGALHGLWAGCALAGCRPDQRSAAPLQPGCPERRQAGKYLLPQRRICIVALIGLAIKLCADLLPGGPVTTGMSGIPVVPLAHLYGALAGIAYVMAWRMKASTRNGPGPTVIK